MGFRDRFYTPQTAKAILSWRIAVGIGFGVALGIAGLPLGVAIAGGAALYAGLVGVAMPKGRSRPTIDPFVLGEPWRQLIQSAQGSGRRLRDTVNGTSDGPLKTTLRSIADQLEHGLDEAWAIARRGDEIDDAVRRLDPTRLRSKLTTAQQHAAADPSPDAAASVASLERQLATADRLRRRSDETAASLRRTQTQLDELVARAAEVQIGAADTDAYARDVDELVIRLEALHQAVQETSTS